MSAPPLCTDYLVPGLAVLFFCASGPKLTAAVPDPLSSQEASRLDPHSLYLLELEVLEKLLYVICLALFNPDVYWDRKNNQEPWNKVGPSVEYEFYSVSRLKQTEERRPRLLNEMFRYKTT